MFHLYLTRYQKYTCISILSKSLRMPYIGFVWPVSMNRTCVIAWLYPIFSCLFFPACFLISGIISFNLLAPYVEWFCVFTFL